MIPQPTDAKITRLDVDGYNILGQVKKIEVYEDVCKQFKTAKITVVDNNNALINLIQPPAKCSFSFTNLLSTSATDVYSDNMKIIGVHKEGYSKSLRAMIYTISLHGDEYFADKANIVQQAFKNKTATDAIKIIHGQFFGTNLSIKVPSIGMIAQETSHIISSLNPHTAIHKIKNLASYAQYKTGSSLYFRDAIGHVIAPLEHLFDTLAPQQVFSQRATWGSHWGHVLGNGTYHAIIEAVADVDANKAASSRSTQDISGSAKQGNIIFDMKTKSYVLQKILGQVVQPGKLSGSIDSIINSISSLSKPGNIGGRPNFQVWDTNQMAKAILPSLQADKERLYQAAARNGPSYKIEVPVQSGLSCTVGKGVSVKLLPPSGDLGGPLRNSVPDLMMVTELVHIIHNDDAGCKGTTTMRVITGGYAA